MSRRSLRAVGERWFVVQHVAYERPGLVVEAAAARGLVPEPVRADQGDALPEPADVAGLVVLGGPMGAYEEDRHPYLADEKALLAAVVAAGRPVLGICLGAQLLAAALGARVYPGPSPEVGLGTVTLTDDGRRDPVLGPGRHLPVLQWHGDTFDLPAGAVRLASSPVYREQAFRVGGRAYGLQFHVEVDNAWADATAAQWPGDAPVDRRHLALVTRAGRAVLGRFFALAREQPA